uniref:Uncharacterized protein n=1 Tax=Candidatus Kentrum sp. TC TaxID=2126339 RepID=A0A450YFV4_9GAMM|nr:MAG: hypothetical protein BECKTC1821E_GA0114239_100731 [Candidatus Kentron sp. TC]
MAGGDEEAVSALVKRLYGSLASRPKARASMGAHAPVLVIEEMGDSGMVQWR